MTLDALRDIYDALSRADDFMTGFEDDETQETVADDLHAIRTARGLVASAIHFHLFRPKGK